MKTNKKCQAKYSFYLIWKIFLDLFCFPTDSVIQLYFYNNFYNTSICKWRSRPLNLIVYSTHIYKFRLNFTLLVPTIFLYITVIPVFCSNFQSCIVRFSLFVFSLRNVNNVKIMLSSIIHTAFSLLKILCKRIQEIQFVFKIIL